MEGYKPLSLSIIGVGDILPVKIKGNPLHNEEEDEMLNRIIRFLKKLKSCSCIDIGYTLVEAATVVGITATMAIIAIPIASEKMEDSKISTASATTKAIGAAVVKFFGETASFPMADGTTGSVTNGVIIKKLKILRTGIGETNNNLEPNLDINLNNPDLQFWAPASAETTDKADAGDDKADGRKRNLNDHLVSDAVGYGEGGLNWLGPYIPVIDQDPWGRNYLIYVRALDFDSFAVVGSNPNVKVPATADSGGRRIFGWIISGGPDEKLQTAPTDPDIKGDDIGTILALPAQVKGANDKGQDLR